MSARCAAGVRTRAFCHGAPAGIQRNSSSAERFEGAAGQRQVRVVDRVEAAAEEADASRALRERHQSGAQFTQSRGRRKSLYRRASGVPGSGAQS